MKISTRFSFINALLLSLFFLVASSIVSSVSAQTYTTPGTQTFTVPVGVESITIQVWGAGGRGGERTSNGEAGGGGGGAYSLQTIAVTPGQVLTLNVGNGSNSTAPGGDSWLSTTGDVRAQ